MVANSTIAISNVARGVSRVALKPCRVASVRAASTSTSSSFTSQNPYYPLYPSVHQLLSEKGIPHADISKIRATGPKGRLLKGDVLCYIGALDQDVSLKLAQTIAKRDHLDLSNINIAPPPAPAKAEDAVPPIPAATAAQVPTTTTLSVRVPIAKVKSAQAKLSEKAGREVSLDALFVRAAKVANEKLPLTAAQLKRINDEVLWNDILGVQTVRAPKYSRGEYVADVAPVKG
ncbi:pyridoxine biosynthesis protein, partial [Ascosphaera pollenicola]